MKKKFDLKLTAILVSLFIGLLLVILGNKNQYCLSFGFIVLGFSLGFYAVNKINKLNELIALADKEIDEAEVDEYYVIIELQAQKKKFKKQRNFTCTMFFICAILLVVLGFTGLF